MKKHVKNYYVYILCQQTYREGVFCSRIFNIFRRFYVNKETNINREKYLEYEND